MPAWLEIVMATYEYLDCYNPVYAENVVVEYMKRYATGASIGCGDSVRRLLAFTMVVDG